MISKIKQKAKEKGQRYANKLFGPSSEHSVRQLPSVLVNDARATNTPVPSVALQEPGLNLNALEPLGSPPQITPISSPQPAVASIALPAPDASPPLTQANVSHPPVVQDAVPIQGSSSVSTAPSVAERSGTNTAWSGLKTLIELLNASADAFGPLKSAVGGISKFIEINDARVAAGKEYKELHRELDELFRNLSGYLGDSMPLAMKSSLDSLANGIKREVKFVQGKEQRNQGKRFAEAIEDADKILECYRRIQRLLERFSLNVNVSTWKTVDEQATENRLKALSPSLSARYGSSQSTDLRRTRCIPNTRIDLLEQLKGWADDSNSERIFWLNGMAGTGKTTIAYSLCDHLEGGLTLAASFFCSRQLPACRNVNQIIPTVAYQLARFSLPFRHALSSALELSPDVHTLNVSTQFQKLVVEPLRVVPRKKHDDLVVVVDALDECDSKDGVDQILETLLLHAPGLPIKFFVTSRPEPRIVDQMQSEQNRGVPAKLDLHNLEHSVVREDIRTYLKVKLESPRLALTDANLEMLVDRSGVLFIYAATVARYIGVDNFSRSAKRLAQVLAMSTSSRTRSSAEVDSLYEDIMKASLEDMALDESERQEMEDVLHTVICAQEPMTTSVIAALLKLDVDSVEAALRPLSSVLHLSSETNGIVTTFHQSFPDYMLHKSRSRAYFCDAGSQNSLLAQRCFDLVAMCNPPFNICGLESSYVLDKDVPGIDQKVETAISDEMFYACRYWGSHLVLIEPSLNLVDALRDFLLGRLLLWMEVMNLKQCLSAGVAVLHRVQAWLQNASSSDDVREIAVDAWRFALNYSTSPMSLSTPHLYMSALPFWSDLRPISRNYLPKMHSMTAVTGTAMRRRRSAPLAVCSAASEVLCVAYSFDSTRIISGSSDYSIQIWDAHTGQMVGEPLEGHTNAVLSVACSHDGTRIASGSKDNTIRIWDANTGQMVGEPLKGHTDSVLSVGYSHDGTHIVSGSFDKTVRIWDADTGQMVGEPLQGHIGLVNSVEYSHDSARIVSGSADKTIRIWDARTGQMVGKPLRGHAGLVRSVGYSHDDTRIVSGSGDNTVRIWDANTGQMVGEPLKGHTDSVLSVRYSRDGTHIISGSFDKTVRIWDAHTGQMVGEPLQGHANWVRSVGYSHDGTRIVSGSSDSTIRIWEARAGQMVDELLQSHTDWVLSVEYSRDGTRIVSGSDDNTIRIWDADTGQMIGDPLKGHASAVNSVRYSHDGTHIVSGSDDKTIQIWDSRTAQMVGDPLRGHTGSVNSVDYSRDGTRMVSGSSDSTIRIWDAHTGCMVGEPLRGHTGTVLSVEYSHDGTRICSGSEDKTIRIWDAQTGQMVGEPLGGHTGAVNSVRYSSNDTRIVSGADDTTIRIWDVRTGQMVGEPLQGHTNPVLAAGYSYDGTRIVSSSADSTIRIWDAYTGRMLGEPLQGHTNAVRSVGYSHDGTRIVSGSEDKTIRTWDARANQILDGTLNDYSTSVPAVNPKARPGQPASDTPIELSPTPPNRPTANSHAYWRLAEDGWVLGSQSNLLVWVPPELRDCLLYPQNLVMISTRGSLALDFSHAQLGDNWSHCYRFKHDLPLQ